MNKNQKMDIVLQLDETIKVMDDTIAKMSEITPKDIGDYRTPENAFYQACVKKLLTLRDQIKYGYERMEVEAKYRSVHGKIHYHTEYNSDGNQVLNRTYGPSALAAAREENGVDASVKLITICMEANPERTADMFARYIAMVVECEDNGDVKEASREFFRGELKNSLEEITSKLTKNK